MPHSCCAHAGHARTASALSCKAARLRWARLFPMLAACRAVCYVSSDAASCLPNRAVLGQCPCSQALVSFLQDTLVMLIT